MATMADRIRERERDNIHDPKQIHVHTAQMGHLGPRYRSNDGPSSSQIVALITLLPVSGTLLFLAGLTLVGSIIGLMLATPVFLLFSPVIVPAALLLGLAVTGFLSSGAFGLTGLSALSRVAMYLRQMGHTVPDDLEYAKRRVADMAAYAGQKTKDVGQTVESKARESGTHPTGTGKT